MLIKLRRIRDEDQKHFNEIHFFKISDIVYCQYNFANDDNSVYLTLKNDMHIMFNRSELQAPTWQALNDKIFNFFNSPDEA